METPVGLEFDEFDGGIESDELTWREARDYTDEGGSDYAID